MVNARELPGGKTRDALALPEGGLAPLPSCGELMTQGLLRSTIKVLGFPAIFRSAVLITLTQLF